MKHTSGYNNKSPYIISVLMGVLVVGVFLSIVLLSRSNEENETPATQYSDEQIVETQEEHPRDGLLTVKKYYSLDGALERSDVYLSDGTLKYRDYYRADQTLERSEGYMPNGELEYTEYYDLDGETLVDVKH